MNTTEHLLTCLGEEGSEITQAASKALRFGPNDTNILKPKGPNNTERLAIELNDLLAVADMLVEEGLLPADWMNLALQQEKKGKVRRFMAYARNVGALEDRE